MRDVARLSVGCDSLPRSNVTRQRPRWHLLNTPGTDGRQALAAIEADPDLRAVPVVLSTSANPKDLEFCHACQANGCHVKPVRYPDQLQAIIDILVYGLSRLTRPNSGASS